ncbi:MAG: TIGR00269 family protein [Candidatus Thermoplasmatota archaeon]|nr:TIGR00269 family protein [Candidatus Thermoplasmatota archaeon]
MQCSFCSNEAVVFLKYNGSHLCDKHFIKFFQKRVNLEFRSELKIRNPVRIGVALSGGKDSSVALYETQRVFGKRRDVSIVAITIDEGIESYRPETIRAAKSLTMKLGIEHKIMKIEESFGTTMDSVSEGGRLAPCSYCGVFRRKLINSAGIDENLDYMVTGLNLDDTAQSMMMNIVRGDIARLGRMGPHTVPKDGLVPRLQPLRKIAEKEVMLYAILQGIDFSHSTCPYADRALRNEFRDSIDKWEERSPGTKYSIINSFDKIKTMMPIEEDIKMGKCRICGSPTPGDICQSCSFERELGTWT